MSSVDVAVIDYGVGNLLSVKRALEYHGATVRVSSDPTAILECSHVVLPGVGAFGDGMRSLERMRLAECVVDVAESGRPLLGICLGMQMLMESSEEFGFHKGLGIISGPVVRIPAYREDGTQRKIPHIGWGALTRPYGDCRWDMTPMKSTLEGESAYFVHSYMAVPQDDSNRLVDCRYDGLRVTAGIMRDNVFGLQFHPEKSGPVGLRILENFLCL